MDEFSLICRKTVYSFLLVLKVDCIEEVGVLELPTLPTHDILPTLKTIVSRFNPPP